MPPRVAAYVAVSVRRPFPCLLSEWPSGRLSPVPGEAWWPDAGPSEAWSEAEGCLGLVGILLLVLLSEEEEGPSPSAHPLPRLLCDRTPQTGPL